MDKNPEEVRTDNFENVQKIITKNSMCMVLYSNPFTKISFVSKIIHVDTFSKIYLDFDLLYSGYVNAGIIKENDNVRLFQVSINNFLDVLKSTIKEVSEKRCVVIIDTVNGLYNLYGDNKDAGRQINSYIMLLVSVAQATNSLVLSMSQAKKRKDAGWIITPTGRHLVDVKSATKIFLSEERNGIKVNDLSTDDSIMLE